MASINGAESVNGDRGPLTGDRVDGGPSPLTETHPVNGVGRPSTEAASVNVVERPLTEAHPVNGVGRPSTEAGSVNGGGRSVNGGRLVNGGRTVR